MIAAELASTQNRAEVAEKYTVPAASLIASEQHAFAISPETTSSKKQAAHAYQAALAYQHAAQSSFYYAITLKQKEARQEELASSVWYKEHAPVMYQLGEAYLAKAWVEEGQAAQIAGEYVQAYASPR